MTDPEPYLSPISRTTLLVLDSNHDYCVVRSATRAWLSRPGRFRAATIPDGGFAQLVAYGLLAETIGGSPAFIQYRLSKEGRAWIRQWREARMSIYHKNPTVYQMAWTNHIASGETEKLFRQSLYDLQVELNVFIHDDGGAWVLAHAQGLNVTYIRIYDLKSGGAVESGATPQVVRAAMTAFLDAYDLLPLEEVKDGRAEDGAGSAGQEAKAA